LKAIALLAAALLALARAGAPAPDPGPRTGGVTTRYDDYFRKYSKRYFGVGTDWRLFKAQAMAESGLLPTARSEAGARGIMQLMPSTFAQIASARPNYQSIDDPQWNIAAGILHDRYLWSFWADKAAEDDRHRFMFGAYNAGEVTIARAQAVARKAQLDPAVWPSVETVAPRVRRWRYRETLRYVRTIDRNYERLRPAEELPAP
jgi:membrane-bound lytic murein transglycosylase MltF